MNKYRVTFEVFANSGRKERVPMEVEAGTKKLAVLRAMQKIGQIDRYNMAYKNVLSVEEVK